MPRRAHIPCKWYISAPLDQGKKNLQRKKEIFAVTIATRNLKMHSVYEERNAHFYRRSGTKKNMISIDMLYRKNYG